MEALLKEFDRQIKLELGRAEAEQVDGCQTAARWHKERANRLQELKNEVRGIR